MRVVEAGTQSYTEVVCLDEPGQGNACHQYKINPIGVDQNPPLTEIHFQDGPIREVGVNGCMNEDLIAILIDRLKGFQSGDYNCRENEIALTKLEEALHWLNNRTAERVRRGVEGTHEE